VRDLIVVHSLYKIKWYSFCYKMQSYGMWKSSLVYCSSSLVASLTWHTFFTCPSDHQIPQRIFRRSTRFDILIWIGNALIFLQPMPLLTYLNLVASCLKLGPRNIRHVVFYNIIVVLTHQSNFNRFCASFYSILYNDCLWQHGHHFLGVVHKTTC
jgi:hypothetical protein